MAHADYNCCAICDCKLEYAGFNSVTKERICEKCLLRLQELGLKIVTVSQLLDWIKNEDEKILCEMLNKMGFRFCYYENDVDDAVRAKGIMELF